MNLNLKGKMNQSRSLRVHSIVFCLTLLFSSNLALSRDWFVRPGIYQTNFDSTNRHLLPVVGVYGNQDGTSYDNAWNGLTSVLWGPSGVAAGDNLYICGVHLYQTSSINYIGSQAKATLTASGSPGTPITIRMDYGPDPGTLWGIFLDNIKADGPARWTGPDSNGIFKTTDLQWGAATEYKDGEMIWLNAETTPNVGGHFGAVYNLPQEGTPWWVARSYVKTIDGSDPSGRIYSPSWGYGFNLGRNSYITFYKCRLYGVSIDKERDSSPNPEPLSHHIVFDSCDIRYSAFWLYKGHDDWTFRNCEISHAANGVYCLGQDGGGANRLTIEKTQIHDIGTPPTFYDNDCHCIGVQGGDGHLIQYNNLWNGGGAAIEFWNGSLMMTNMTVQYNFIRDIHVRCLTDGGGIGVSGDNVLSVVGTRTGFKIIGNVIMNTGIGATESWQGGGIGSNNKDDMEISNNIVFNSKYGISLLVVNGAVQGHVTKNLVINPAWKYSQVIGDPAPMPTNLVWDYNLYSPAQNQTGDFVYYPNFIHDQNSIYADPQFKATTPRILADFDMAPGSPVWGLGFQPIPINLINTSLGPTLSPVTIIEITDRSALLSWTTDLECESEVAYGLTPSYGHTWQFIRLPSTTHQIRLGGLNPNSIYHFQVTSRDRFGVPAISGDYSFRTLSDSNPEQNGVEFSPFKNYFNPAKGEKLVLEYNLNKSGRIKITAVTRFGSEVKIICDEEQTLGTHRLEWDGRNESGSMVASGVYLLKLSAGDESIVKNAVVVK